MNLLCGMVSAQSLRYFQFHLACGHGNWQDTSLIAATADQSLIDTVLVEMEKPMEQRRFISGNITSGNAGYNHNADHWFLWHFVPGEWQLASFAVEVCDGCPYTDVDGDTAYWLGTLGFFCPWSGQPAREVPAPTGIEHPGPAPALVLYPNPAKDVVILESNTDVLSQVSLHDMFGREMIYPSEFRQKAVLDLKAIGRGVYFVTVQDKYNRVSKRLVVSK